MLSKFRELEESNFAKFNFINELSSEIKGSDQQIQELEIQYQDLLNFEQKSNVERKQYLRSKDVLIGEFDRDCMKAENDCV